MGLHGGQRRTVTCGCGWSAISVPDRLDTIYRLHKKKCEIANKSTHKPSDTPFNTVDNGMRDIKNSKHGNLYVSHGNALARD
jgi:hypothetical protein